MPETKSIMDMEEDERQEYIEWGVQTLIRRGHDSVEDAELEQWGLAMKSELDDADKEIELLSQGEATTLLMDRLIKLGWRPPKETQEYAQPQSR